jgi:Tfp pilus assembly protein FimV
VGGVAVGEGWVGVSVGAWLGVDVGTGVASGADTWNAAQAWLPDVASWAATSTCAGPVQSGSEGKTNDTLKRPSSVTVADARYTSASTPVEGASRRTKTVSPSRQPAPVAVTKVPGEPATGESWIDGARVGRGVMRGRGMSSLASAVRPINRTPTRPAATRPNATSDGLC